MKIEYESLRKFAPEHGDVRIYSPRGEAVIPNDGTADIYSIIDKADTFLFDGKKYTRPEFEQLLEKSK